MQSVSFETNIGGGIIASIFEQESTLRGRAGDDSMARTVLGISAAIPWKRFLGSLLPPP